MVGAAGAPGIAARRGGHRRNACAAGRSPLPTAACCWRGCGGCATRAATALAITPSRRTPDAVRALLAEAFAGDQRVFLWDMEGDNPYRGILALADRLVVTSDSVSMVSEALSTTHPVEIFDLGFPRHADFHPGIDRQGPRPDASPATHRRRRWRGRSMRPCRPPRRCGACFRRGRAAPDRPAGRGRSRRR